MTSITGRLRDERTPLYKRAFPDANWEAAGEELARLPTLTERVDYLTNKFPGLIRIACSSSSGAVQAHVQRAREAFTRIINRPENLDKTGADLGLTSVPPGLLEGLLTRYAVNSNAVKFGEVAEIANATPDVHGGATAYFCIFVLPSRDGDVSGMHTEKLVVPEDPADETYVNCTSISYAGPRYEKERKVIMENLGVTEMDLVKKDGTLDNLLLASDGSVWGSESITAFLRPEHVYLTSVEVLSQCRTPGLEKLSNDAECTPIFQLRMAFSVKLTREEHGALKRLARLSDVSTARGHMLMAGNQTSENSCFANCVYDIACVTNGLCPPSEVFSSAPDSLFYKLNERADVVYVANEFGSHLRLKNFIDKEKRERYFHTVPKATSKKLIQDFFSSESLYNIYSSGAASWANKYTTHAEELPTAVDSFFGLATDTFASYVEELAALP
ncbi:hypothetical protein ACKVWC_003400 [Pyricularia oryzae]